MYRSLRSRSDLQPYALHLRVQVERIAPELPPVAALLVAAKGRGRVEDVVAVDPHRPGAERARHPVRLAHVARPDAGGQAVRGVVALEHGIVLVLEGNHRDDRPEDLLARDLHVVAHTGEDRRLHEVALLETFRRVPLAADERLGALLLPDLEVAGHAFELFLADQRPDPRVGVERISLLHALGALRELLRDLVVHLLLDEEPRAGAADLAGAEEDAEERALHGGL